MNPLRAEDLIECAAELLVTIVDQDSEKLALAELHHEVACLLRHPPSVRCAVQATYSIRRVASEMKKTT